MNRSILIVIAVGVFVSVISGSGCAQGGVGDPCIPEAEYDTCFAGFDIREVNTESRSFQCQTRLCLVNHFQGRVSCPFGQTGTATSTPTCPGSPVDLPMTPCTSSNPSPATNTAAPWCTGFTGPDAPAPCTIPGGTTVLSGAGTGIQTEYAVKVNVLPQVFSRQTTNAVYCSCRCANSEGKTDDGAVYCQCPEGTMCQQQLVTNINASNTNLAGGYCIKGTGPLNTTAYDPATSNTTILCNANPSLNQGHEPCP